MKAIDRIYQYLEYKSFKIADFEKKNSISNGYLSKMRQRSASIGEDILNQILENCPDISPEWLLTGSGNMLRSEIPVAVPASGSDPGIPLIPIEAMAGFARGEAQVLEYECERYVVPIFKEAEFLIQVKGSSMYPKYSSGDVIACKKLPLQDIFFQWNKVYVLDTIQGALIKRVKKGKDSEHVIAVSENEKYEPFELNIRQILSVAIVIGVIRLE